VWCVSSSPLSVTKFPASDGTRSYGPDHYVLPQHSEADKRSLLSALLPLSPLDFEWRRPPTIW
jgi:hypothetical protein